MKRSLFILVGVLALSAALFFGTYLCAQRFCASRLARSTDDLDWLRQEFHLGDAEMARIQKLHEGYLPKCSEMCKKIAAQKLEVEAALAAVTNLTAVPEPASQNLRELALLRAQCQLQMLQHFVEVSQAMPPEPGRRYLAQMQRLTLGFHEQVEQTMSGSMGHDHGSH